MPDETLTTTALLERGPDFLRPFIKEQVRGASYDIRVGEVVIVADPDSETGVTSISLGAAEGQEEYKLPPGRAAVIRSLEKLNLPSDMRGFLSIRSLFATKLLFFAGGPIAPGYNGYLFFPVANLSDGEIPLRFGESLVTAEFVRLTEPTAPYNQGRQRDVLPKDRLPVTGVRKPYNPVQLSDKVDRLENDHQKLSDSVRSHEPAIQSTERILNVVILGAVAGAMAGILVGAWLSIPHPWNIVTLVGVPVVSVVGFFVLKRVGIVRS